MIEILYRKDDIRGGRAQVEDARRADWPRRIVQTLFLLLVLGIGLNHSAGGWVTPVPFLPRLSVHAICPFGGVETAYTTLTQGRLVQEVRDSSLALMWTVFGLSLLFGAVSCGWLCPLGTVQDLISSLSRRLFGKGIRLQVPPKVDRALSYTRYAVLAWVLYATATSGILVFSGADPFKTLFSFGRELTLGGIVVLGITLVASVFIERPWCKYACPYGGLLGLTNYTRLFKLRRSVEVCTDCTLCEKVCPMNVEICGTEVVKDTRCIACMKCTSGMTCRVENALEFRI
jgi:hypothetical protein